MNVLHRGSRGWLLPGLWLLLWTRPLPASYCPFQEWTLSAVASAPVLVTGRVVSVEMQNGPHFTGNPKRSAPEQKMTAEIEVLRFTQKPDIPGSAPAEHLRLRFVGRDGPDFGPCGRELPVIQPGQVLLLPLRTNAGGGAEPWRLIGAEGEGMTLRVTAEMREPPLASPDGRLFLIRELVNSFHGHDPLAKVGAASRIAIEDAYLEPDLSTRIRHSLGENRTLWAELLGSILIAYPSGPLTLAEVRSGAAHVPWKRFQGFPLAQLALTHLPGAASETLVWRALWSSLPGLADQPYHPLFSYNASSPLHAAANYLLRDRDNPVFLNAMKTALREDRPGSSYLASRLIAEGHP